MTLNELDLQTLESLDEILDHANHDVAKYMAMTARNVSAESLGEEETEMILDDLRQTNGSDPAWLLWKQFSEQLKSHSVLDEIKQIDGAMDSLRDLVEHPDPAQNIGQIIPMAMETANRISSLRRQVRKLRIEATR